MTEIVSARVKADDDGVAEGVHFEGAFYSSRPAVEVKASDAAERGLLVEEIVNGLDNLSIQQLMGFVSIVRARSSVRESE